MVGQHRAWNAFIALRQHTWSDNVGRGMPSFPLGSTDGRTTSGWPLDDTQGQTTSGMACHHGPWTAHTVRRRRAWHDITVFGQHIRSNDIGRGMPSSPLGSTHGRQRREWHDITAFGKHTRSDNVRHGMTSPPLGKTHGWQRQVWHDNTAFGQHTWSKNVGRGMPSSPLGSTHGRTTLGVACYHSPWTANTVKRR